MKQKNITDSDVEMKSQEMKDLLTMVLQRAGEKANVNINDIKKEIDFMQNDLERIKIDYDIDKIMKPHVLKLIINDLTKIYHEDLESSFQNELKGYSIPYLKLTRDDSETIRLSDIDFDKPETATVVLGETGAGKTAMTKFLFQSWLAGNTEALKGLAEFDIVLRLQCNRIRSSDLNQFFEDHLPIASYSFSNTSTLSRHFKDYKVFWIMDGFDESTSEFRGFLETVLRYLPQNHKIFITTRFHTYEEVEKYFKNFNIDKLILQKLNTNNINEMVKYRICEEEEEAKFHLDYCFLTNEEKMLLQTPVIFVLYIDLWKEDLRLVLGPITLIKLYIASTERRLKLLRQKHQNKSQLVTEEDLNSSIDNWFYGSLCKQCFLNVVASKFGLDDNEIKHLRDEAIKSYLIPSICLSTFLEGGPNYRFNHASQLLFYAASFMTKLECYPYFDMLKNVSKCFDFYTEELLNYYIQVESENNSLNNRSEQIFGTIHKFISSFNENDQGYVWLEASVSLSFNENFMQPVSELLKSCLYIDMRTLFQPTLYKFISAINPIKIVINTNIGKYDTNGVEHLDYSISRLLKCLNNFEYGKLQIELISSMTENEERVIKSQIMNCFENAKHSVYYYEVLSSAIIQALRWLYVGQESLEKHLVDLAEYNKSDLSSKETYFLKELAKGNSKIEELDPTILLKVAKIIYEVDDRKNFSWTKLFQTLSGKEIDFNKLISKFDRLPHLCVEKFSNPITGVYNIFNRFDRRFIISELFTETVAHNIAYFYSNKTNDVITEQLKKDVESKIQRAIEENMTEKYSPATEDFDSDLLKSILSEAGNYAHLEAGKINIAIGYFQERLRDLSSKRHFDIISTIHAKNVIINELTTKYENGKTYLEMEMDRYIPATLVEEGGNKKK